MMADKPTPTLPPQSEPFPGSTTPGWNDPPPLQCTPGAAAGRTRLNLNKRVAFPLQGTVGESSNVTAKPTAIVPPNQASCMPPPLPPTGNIAVVHPMPNMNVPPPVSPRIAAVPVPATTAETRTSLPSDAQEYALRVLRDRIYLVQESLHIRREELHRRLGIIEQLWQSGNLSLPVQERIYRLAKAMADTNFNEAMEYYTALVTNHSNECATWLVALRHIVLTIQPKSDDAPSAAGASESGSSAAIPAMYVPAMPRQSNTATNEPAANAAESARAAVQHI